MLVERSQNVRVYRMNIAHMLSSIDHSPSSQSPYGTTLPIIESFMEIVLVCKPAEYFSANTYLLSQSHLFLKWKDEYSSAVIHGFSFFRNHFFFEVDKVKEEFNGINSLDPSISLLFILLHRISCLFIIVSLLMNIRFHITNNSSLILHSWTPFRFFPTCSVLRHRQITCSVSARLRLTWDGKLKDCSLHFAFSLTVRPF